MIIHDLRALERGLDSMKFSSHIIFSRVAVNKTNILIDFSSFLVSFDNRLKRAAESFRRREDYHEITHLILNIHFGCRGLSDRIMYFMTVRVWLLQRDRLFFFCVSRSVRKKIRRIESADDDERWKVWLDVRQNRNKLVIFRWFFLSNSFLFFFY